MSRISLNMSTSTNLLSLQSVSKQMGKTQTRLATGKKVNSAIDNPSSYYTARSLSNRASDLSALLDSMGQKIQTIQAAIEGIEAATSFLEQMTSVAEQAMENRPVSKAGLPEAGEVPEPALVSKDIQSYIDEGYTVLSSDMDVSDIYDLLNYEGGKFVLADDVDVGDLWLGEEASQELIIDGNGHSLTTSSIDGFLNFVTGDNILTNIELRHNNGDYGRAAINIWGDARLTMSNVKITMASEQGSATAIQLYEGAHLTAEKTVINVSSTGAEAVGIDPGIGSTVELANTVGISVSGIGTQQIRDVGGNISDLYAGRANTAAALAQLGDKVLAAKATTLFYAPGVEADDATFGQGKWYLPSIGELMDVYGYDAEAIEDGDGTSGMTGTNKTAINNALQTLKSKGVAAEKLQNTYYWSSSESSSTNSWKLDMTNGGRNILNKNGSSGFVRSFLLLENCFDPSTLSAGGVGGSGGESAPKIGDIMYADKTWGKAADYSAGSGKKVVGVITNVSDSGDVTIMNLLDLRFSSRGSVGNFDAANPYGHAYQYSYWATSDVGAEDVAGIPNYDRNQLALTFNPSLAPEIIIEPQPEVFVAYNSQFNELFSQYDKLIQDSSYQGVNLLTGDSMEITFNEARDNQFMVQGQDISAAAIGLNTAEWSSLRDVETSLQELKAAVSTLRAVAGDLGNNNAIIQTRQDFTQNLINVLEEGADKLTLADMNEEAANMLALQMRQQLAINALSLASQADQSILKLF